MIWGQKTHISLHFNCSNYKHMYLFMDFMLLLGSNTECFLATVVEKLRTFIFASSFFNWSNSSFNGSALFSKICLMVSGLVDSYASVSGFLASSPISKRFGGGRRRFRYAFFFASKSVWFHKQKSIKFHSQKCNL